MNAALNANRTSRLKKRFSDILSGSVKLDPLRGATLFLEGLCAQDDPVECLDAITESPHGISSVQSAMQFDLSVQFMNGLGSTVLQYLLKASAVGGDTLDNLLFHVVEPPIFWSVFVRVFQDGALSEDAQLVFAQVLSRLLTLQDHDTSPYRDIAARPSVQNSLTASSNHQIREAGHLLKHILSSSGSLTVYDIRNGPGGRHDNDFADYDHIAFLPTADEILCRKPPFLRPVIHDELDESETPVKEYLDNTFRLLREDMVSDIREEIQSLLKENRNHRGFCYNVSMDGVYTGTQDRKTRWGIRLVCDSDFWQMKDIVEEEDRVNFLTRDPRGSRMLKNQTLVCLMSDREVISFGTISRVEELLACNPPVIVLQLDGDVNARKTITFLSKNQSAQLVQISTAIFAFEPVLAALKKCSMRSIPLSEDIVLWNPESPVELSRNEKKLSHITNRIMSNPSVDISDLLDLSKSIHLDEAQARSLITGIRQRVSLIQGPPGTGKSFIGAILAKAIHVKTSQTILVVCYTNHALDQFLEDLLAYGIPAEDIVRLGGRANKSTDHLTLYKQPRERVVYDWDDINSLKSSASSLEARLGAEFERLLGDMMAHLRCHHRKFYDAFYVPPETEDGMIRVGANGRAIRSDYLFSRWKRGLDAGVLRGEPHIMVSAQIWGMPRSARERLFGEWQEEIVVAAVESVCQAGRRFNSLQDAIKQKFAKPTVTILQQKRIIACTTTGAAIYADTLDEVRPDVLLVEEAGEILESHIVTALSRSINQMILIGDHKQLRPKVNNYQLTVERGEGFDLNRSLFERLILKGYPHVTLATQHRMRPEISAFVRELTYPELVDDPSTHQRPDIRGVQSNIIFVDHSHPEDDDALIADHIDSGSKSSKQNTYEVQMVLKIVRYLAQQGYGSEDIAVLTPYLGQLHHLRDALKGENDPILNELDSSDLARAGLSPSAPQEVTTKKGRIRLATIDNYQGEESDIIIASLTRSNKSNTIGFMDSPERLNVLLSRARNCLILIGNSRTFLDSRKGGRLWKHFFSLLEAGRYVYGGFPVKCDKHPERIALLTCAADFEDHCPDGGCKAPCGFNLACGHTCAMQCHPRRLAVLRDPHETSHCKAKMSAMCPAGHHRITWECRLGRPSACLACKKEAKRLEEIARQEREQQQKREEAEAEHRRQLAELEAKLQEEKAAEERRSEERRAARIREEERKEAEEVQKRWEERWRKWEEEKERKETAKRIEQQREREEAKLILERRQAARLQEERVAEQQRLEQERVARLREERRRQVEVEEAQKRWEEQRRKWEGEEERKETAERIEQQRKREEAKLKLERRLAARLQEERVAEGQRLEQERVARLQEERRREEAQKRKWERQRQAETLRTFTRLRDEAQEGEIQRLERERATTEAAIIREYQAERGREKVAPRNQSTDDAWRCAVQ